MEELQLMNFGMLMLGLCSGMQKDKNVFFCHPRNLLSELWGSGIQEVKYYSYKYEPKWEFIYAAHGDYSTYE